MVRRAQIAFCMASLCALVLLAVAAPAAFASSAKQQVSAQEKCPLLIEWDTDADSNGKVSIMQRQLSAIGKEDLGDFTAGHSGVDGIFGPVTLKAVIHFQKTHTDPDGKPLAHDGKVGPKTWAALGGCGAAPPTKCQVNPNNC